MVSCAVRRCCNNNNVDNKRTSGVTFHRFPKDSKRQSLWVAFVKRGSWTPTKYSVLCSNHFEEKYFDRTSLCYVRLRENAVPSLLPYGGSVSRFPSATDRKSESEDDPLELKTSGKKTIKTSSEVLRVESDCVEVKSESFSSEEIDINDTWKEEPIEYESSRETNNMIPIEVESNCQDESLIESRHMLPVTTHANSVSTNSSFRPVTKHNVIPSTSNMHTSLKDREDILSEDEEECSGEFGLNSIEELKEFWDFLVEVYEYNRTTIKVLQRKKRRYQLNIKKLENKWKNHKLEFSDASNNENSFIELTQTNINEEGISNQPEDCEEHKLS